MTVYEMKQAKAAIAPVTYTAPTPAPMSDSELAKAVRAYRRAKAKADAAAAELDAAAQILKDECELRGVEVINGRDFKITYRDIQQTRLDSKALKVEVPAVYARYAKQTSYKRFTVA